MTKLLLIITAALILGGCTLLPSTGDAAKDQSIIPIASVTPEPSLSSETTDAALSADIEATIIEVEDFSDLE